MYTNNIHTARKWRSLDECSNAWSCSGNANKTKKTPRIERFVVLRSRIYWNSSTGYLADALWITQCYVMLHFCLFVPEGTVSLSVCLNVHTSTAQYKIAFVFVAGQWSYLKKSISESKCGPTVYKLVYEFDTATAETRHDTPVTVSIMPVAGRLTA